MIKVTLEPEDIILINMLTANNRDLTCIKLDFFRITEKITNLVREDNAMLQK